MLWALLFAGLAGPVGAATHDLDVLEEQMAAGSLPGFLAHLSTCELAAPVGLSVVAAICQCGFAPEALAAVLARLGERPWHARYAAGEAAEHGRASLLARLVQDGNDIFGDGGCALHVAAGAGHLDVVVLCCELGANMNGPLRGEHGYPDLQQVAWHGYNEVLYCLAGAGADIDAAPQLNTIVRWLGADAREVRAPLRDRELAAFLLARAGEGEGLAAMLLSLAAKLVDEQGPRLLR